jgi:prepilin-type N-terminal cleavage/methylation domain-containing protein
MLARIRKSMKEKDQGFTLIELLVVMIIIGILAAIAIPVFLNQRKRAVDSSLKSDLRAIANQMETYYTDNQAYVLPTQATTGGDVSIGSTDKVKVSGTNLYTFKLLSDATTATTVATSATGYCVTGNGNGKGSGAKINYNSLTGGIVATDCP